MTDTQRELGGLGHACTRCLKAQATHHICQFNHGIKEILELCDDCAKKWNKSSAFSLPDIRDAKCNYCGEPAVSGGINQVWEKKVRGCDFHFTCMTCFENYTRLFLKRIETISADLSPESQIEEISKITQAIDKEVRSMAVRSKN